MQRHTYPFAPELLRQLQLIPWLSDVRTGATTELMHAIARRVSTIRSAPTKTLIADLFSGDPVGLAEHGAQIYVELKTKSGDHLYIAPPASPETVSARPIFSQLSEQAIELLCQCNETVPYSTSCGFASMQACESLEEYRSHFMDPEDLQVVRVFQEQKFQWIDPAEFRLSDWAVILDDGGGYALAINAAAEVAWYCYDYGRVVLMPLTLHEVITQLSTRLQAAESDRAFDLYSSMEMAGVSFACMPSMELGK